MPQWKYILLFFVKYREETNGNTAATFIPTAIATTTSTTTATIYITINTTVFFSIAKTIAISYFQFCCL